MFPLVSNATNVMTRLSVDARSGDLPVPGIWLLFSGVRNSPGTVHLMCRGNCLSVGMFQLNLVIALLFQDIFATSSEKKTQGAKPGGAVSLGTVLLLISL